MRQLDCLPLYEDALFYDHEFKDRTHEIPFYLRQAKKNAGPVLEIACGTGRLTLPIAAERMQIAGVDASAPMIVEARRKALAAGLAVDWYVQDARDMDLGRRFALAFIASNSLQHLHDHVSLRAFFSRARAHLQPDGLLIIDVFNPSIAKLGRSLGQPYPHKNFALPDGRRVDVEADSEYIPDGQLLHFILTYRHEGRALCTKDVRMRCFFPEELLALCERGGFEVVDRFGDYDETPFHGRSPKQIVRCRPFAWGREP
jgi:SAM-dependent methyltransferase